MLKLNFIQNLKSKRKKNIIRFQSVIVIISVLAIEIQLMLSSIFQNVVIIMSIAIGNEKFKIFKIKTDFKKECHDVCT